MRIFIINECLEYGKLFKIEPEDRVAVEDQEEAALSYSIRGYHVYRAIWSAALGGNTPA